MGSHDLEHIVSIIDGRDTLVEELSKSGEGVRSHIHKEFNSMVKDPAFIDALPAFLQPDDASQERAGLSLARMKELNRGASKE